MIKITNTGQAFCDDKLLGYMGEYNARTIEIEYPRFEGTEYRLYFDVGNENPYMIELTGENFVVDNSLLVSARQVEMQFCAYKTDVMVFKSEIFYMYIRESIEGTPEACPTYEQSQDILTQIKDAMGNQIYPPKIGENKNWYIYSSSIGDYDDTGICAEGKKGAQGEAGASGPQGSKGDKGDSGPQGVKGDKGEPGTNGLDGMDGADGKSAYQTAAEAGYTGTEAEFAEVLSNISNIQGFSGDYNDLKNKPSSLPADGGNSDTVNSHTVEADVPENAKFTDTTYEIVTESSSGIMSSDDKKKVNGLKYFSNKNLLINSNFRVNQRGQTIYNTGNFAGNYTVDRWSVSHAGTVEVKDNGILMTSSTSENTGFAQTLDSSIIGKPMTLSLSVNGTVYAASGTVLAETDLLTDFEIGRAYVYTGIAGKTTVQIVINPGTSVTVNWVKLENGLIATEYIANDLAEELNICKRYYRVTRFTVSPGHMFDGSITGYIQDNTDMRIIPTVTAKSMTGALGKVSVGNNSGDYFIEADVLTFNNSGTSRVHFVPPSNANFYSGILYEDAEIY